MPSSTAYAPTVHHTGHPTAAIPTCGTHGLVLVERDWDEVTCKRCLKSWAGRVHEIMERQEREKAQALTQAAIKEAVQGVFEKARSIADRRGYCDVYQSIESEIIADLPFEIEGSEREYEVEVEFEVTIRYTNTLTVEAKSADAAERLIADAPEEYVSDMLQHFVPDNGYVDSMDTTVESVNVV